jgi:hypothetical protein
MVAPGRRQTGSDKSGNTPRLLVYTLCEKTHQLDDMEKKGTNPNNVLYEAQLFPYSLQQDVQPEIHLTTDHDVLPFIFL